MANAACVRWRAPWIVARVLARSGTQVPPPEHSIVQRGRITVLAMRMNAHQNGSSGFPEHRPNNECTFMVRKRKDRMKQPNDVFNEFQAKMSELLKNSPAKDIERNMKAMLSQGFSKLDLVTREEFDTQTQVLVRTRTRLEELERRVAELEVKLGGGASSSSTQD
jgi:BMFP domain-containing protein YqiC